MSIINAEEYRIEETDHKNEKSFVCRLKLNRANSISSADFFNNNTNELISGGETENLVINKESSLNQAEPSQKDKIIKILENLNKALKLNMMTKDNLLRRYEELTNKQSVIENTLEKIKRVNKTKQKKHVKYLRYIPLNKIYFYSPKKNHFYYILMDIVVKSRKKQLNYFTGYDEDDAHKSRYSTHKQKKKKITKEDLMNKSTLRRNMNRYKFTVEEDEILKKLILYSVGEYIDWNKISKDFNDFTSLAQVNSSNKIKSDKIKYKSGLECYTRSLELSEFYNYKKWTNNEDNILKKAILYYGPKNWQQISYCLEGRNNSQAFHRWMKGINPKIKRSKWSFEEDLTLGIALKIYGNKKWSKIANHLGGRTDIQCRERFCNILDPSLEEVEWKPQEDAKLLALFDIMKNKWSKIAKEFGNRTDNTCWRRWKYLETLRKGMAMGINYNNPYVNTYSIINSISNNTHVIDSNSDCTYNNSSSKITQSKKRQKKKEIFRVNKISRDKNTIH
jgi:hypothetical protein